MHTDSAYSEHIALFKFNEDKFREKFLKKYAASNTQNMLSGGVRRIANKNILLFDTL